MKTNFYTNANQWVEESYKDVKSKNYFASWMKTIPAKLNFLADAIINISIAPFNLLKAGFGSIKTVYTWGEDTKDLKNGIKDFHENVNHVISDGAGVIITKAGCHLRDKETAIPLLGIIAMISLIALDCYIFLNADGMQYRYNSWTHKWEPSYFFNFNK